MDYPPQRDRFLFFSRLQFQLLLLLLLLSFSLLLREEVECVRIPERTLQNVSRRRDQQEQDQQQPDHHRIKTAVFALGSFWRSEPLFGCLPGVIRTTVGYAGGTKTKPEYRSLGDHAEAVQIEYDSTVIDYKKVLDVFWSSHDSREVFGQGPDVGNQYRSIIFTNGTEEIRLAFLSKEREQARSKTSIVTTKIMQMETFYPAELEHQKFELRHNLLLLQLTGDLTEELIASQFAAKLNSYAAELCPPSIQKQIKAKVRDITSKGWPPLREL